MAANNEVTNVRADEIARQAAERKSTAQADDPEKTSGRDRLSEVDGNFEKACAALQRVRPYILAYEERLKRQGTRADSRWLIEANGAPAGFEIAVGERTVGLQIDVNAPVVAFVNNKAWRGIKSASDITELNIAKMLRAMSD